ncbi:ferritin-like domain-containing protein [Chromobacterium vaccinii]|uniref:ferritin-like domain-containing protein n=1 Tax=Chromobacterium vaccinii TaxID=1108595 RepID=UPI001E64977E|nr:ferritin-like protein [Chromobacterium vaccinii]MCD4502131.1 ferritin-like protein [Chromobacterium vaccinii]
MNNSYATQTSRGRLRQRLIRPLEPALQALLLSPAPEGFRIGGAIKTIEQLREHLQTAIELEHSTIPVYLTTLYTLDERRNQFAYQAIQGVAMEEMLHMIQVCNILNAVGGSPAINKPDFIPEYPTPLPHSDDAFLVSLQKFSPDAIDTFLKIEMPAGKCAPPEANHYATIGQFYHAIRIALVELDAHNRLHGGPGIFTGDPARQVLPEHYYGGGGKLLPVFELQDALLGIEEIVGQGEGVDGTIIDTDSVLFGQDVEYAHYFRFNEVKHGRRYRPDDNAKYPPTGPAVEVDWQAAADMAPNPKMADYPEGSPVWKQTREFNRIYTSLLDQLHVACNGQPASLAEAIPIMYQLKYQAQALLNLPNGRGGRAGPSFEYIA